MRRVGRVEIMLDGTQWPNGAVERCLTVHGVDTDRNIPTDTARRIAAANGMFHDTWPMLDQDVQSQSGKTNTGTGEGVRGVTAGRTRQRNAFDY
jgi:hypothetical protein